MKQEYTVFVDEKKPETLDALVEVVVDFAESKEFSISKEEVMNSNPDELKSGKMELSDDILDAVVGGSAWEWIQKNAHDFVKSLEDAWWL